jgi:hypothetical protein
MLIHNRNGPHFNPACLNNLLSKPFPKSFFSVKWNRDRVFKAGCFYILWLPFPSLSNFHPDFLINLINSLAVIFSPD